LAIPLAAVLDVSVDIDPPPVCADQFTNAPRMELPYRSATLTEYGTGSLEATLATWLSPSTVVRVVGAPGIAVALNVTGDPDSPETVALAEWVAEASVPRYQVTDDNPSSSVTSEVGDILPLPTTTDQDTLTSATPFPSSVVARTTSGWDSDSVTVPSWLSPLTRAIVAATSGLALSPPQPPITIEAKTAITVPL
jgi:hypothetical protein